MSACNVRPYPALNARSFVAALVEPLFDESSVSTPSASDFDSDFSFEFGGVFLTANMSTATLRDMAGFPLFDETPETGETITVVALSKTLSCKRHSIAAHTR